MYYFLTFLFGLLGTLALLRFLELVFAGSAGWPMSALLAVIFLLLAQFSLSKARNKNPPAPTAFQPFKVQAAPPGAGKSLALIVIGAITLILGALLVLEYFFAAPPRIVTEEYTSGRATAGSIGGIMLLAGAIILLVSRKR